ncbi:hypothetical protein HYE82_33075 [Streptomyces sp. BR123]|nr:hypothetical protein [Streptomyces sp. BR123]NXY99129.1 hypothetical protein [Streptomyces sp. BR123]
MSDEEYPINPKALPRFIRNAGGQARRHRCGRNYPLRSAAPSPKILLQQ